MAVSGASRLLQPRPTPHPWWRPNYPATALSAAAGAGTANRVPAVGNILIAYQLYRKRRTRLKRLLRAVDRRCGSSIVPAAATVRLITTTAPSITTAVASKSGSSCWRVGPAVSLPVRHSLQCLSNSDHCCTLRWASHPLLSASNTMNTSSLQKLLQRRFWLLLPRLASSQLLRE